MTDQALAIFDPIAQFHHTQQEESNLCDDEVPLSGKAMHQYDRLTKIKEWHMSLKRPNGITDKEYPGFMRQAVGYFIRNDQLWKKDQGGQH